MKTPYVKTKIIALSSVFLLAACGGGSSSSGKSTGELEPEVETSLDSATKINFAFQGDNVSVPVPSFLLLDSQTGRLNIPTDGDTSLSNPSVALNQLDGWSTNQAIQIPVTGSGLADGVLSQGVYLIKLTQSLLADSPSVEAVLSVGTDFQAITRASDNTINIIPSQPFDEKSNYILALTSEITDIDGEPVGTSEDYALLKTQTIDLNVEPLEQLQDVTQGIEGIFAQTGVDASSIIYSTWFTTQSVGDTLAATKAAAAAGLANAANGGLASVWKDSANPNSVDLSTAYTMGIAASGDYAQMLDADENFDTYLDPDGAGLKAQLIAAYQGITGADTVTVSKGVVNLPYFLETGDTWNTQPFEAAMPSLALISNALADGSDDQASVGAQLANAGITPSLLASDPQEQLKLIGLDLTKADGTALDSERVVTQYNPVPKIKSLQAVPFILFTPTNPSAATPVVIYQHGITSVKETAYAFAANMAANGVAVIAIDHPLHGDRALDDTRSANADVSAYINLSYLPVARDNLRQSTLDIIGLRTALSFSAQAGLFSGALANVDPTQVRFFGHSLGGITGVSAVAAANETTGSDEADALFNFSGAAFASAGSQIAPLLLSSQTFGGEIKNQLASNLSADYAGFASSTCDAAQLTGSQCFDTFLANATDAQVAAIDSGLASFSFAAQTILDTVDPVNTAYSSSYDALPVYLNAVDGDLVVPNSVDTAPFAGTIPLATALNLTEINQASATSVTGDKDFVFFNDAASHSTVISPQSSDDLAHFSEMQQELIDFLADNQLTGVANPAVLKP